MDLRAASQLLSKRDIRNAIIGIIVVAGGLALAGLTFYAHRSGETRLAGFAAAASLIFVVLILIFVVPPLARNASKEASQMNLPFEFTLSGAIVLGLLLIIGFSAWNTGNNLLFLILSFVAAAFVISFFAGGLMLKKIDVKMRFPETIFAEEETHILVSLTNRKRVIPSFSILAEVRGQLREESAAAKEMRQILPAFLANRFVKAPIVRRTLDHFLYVGSRQTVESRTEHTFKERGCYTIKDFEITTRFPFGFFRHRRRLPARETELIVFPKIEALQHSLAADPIGSGRIEHLRRGLGSDLYSLREYQANDDLRRVDWKATARSTRLTVREFSAEDEERFTIVFDPRVLIVDKEESDLRKVLEAEQLGENPMRTERFEAAVQHAASLLSALNSQRTEFRLIIDGESGEFGVGTRHLHDAMKRLAMVEPRQVDILDVSELHTILKELDDISRIKVFTPIDEADIDPELARGAEFFTL